MINFMGLKELQLDEIKYKELTMEEYNTVLCTDKKIYPPSSIIFLLISYIPLIIFEIFLIKLLKNGYATTLLIITIFLPGLYLLYSLLTFHFSKLNHLERIHNKKYIGVVYGTVIKTKISKVVNPLHQIHFYPSVCIKINNEEKELKDIYITKKDFNKLKPGDNVMAILYDNLLNEYSLRGYKIN